MARTADPRSNANETQSLDVEQDISQRFQTHSYQGVKGHKGFVRLLKLILYLILFGALAGKFLTGSYLWEYEGKWIRLRTYFPPPQLLFTESELAKYDGTDLDRPIYLAIDGDVYDVTKGKAYQLGGPYHLFAGIDAARAFGTGCFKTHRTHDLRGMSDAEIKGMNHWKKFYENHKNYFKVGKVLHPPIDPSSPMVEGCDTKDKGKSGAKKDTVERRALVQDRNMHQEL
ncbi:cytochrome b5-like heme/steroid binding domain-containing protein [Lentinula aff. detonsa]|uniref:Cytochrome b5-like heme/steroid binding domain-containing protein n=1 Tax=Lentinula aff. detonsa TaxID=2804958 RepID=A0AA38NT12_9AGAR|nr:cytochrome b5-like heme/steroid binding domain-containing protein [Lentinula aff. detonsa]